LPYTCDALNILCRSVSLAHTRTQRGNGALQECSQRIRDVLNILCDVLNILCLITSLAHTHTHTHTLTHTQRGNGALQEYSQQIRDALNNAYPAKELVLVGASKGVNIDGTPTATLQHT